MNSVLRRRRWLHKYLLYGIIEDLDTVPHILIGKFWGIPVSVTPLTWLLPLVFFGLFVLLHVRELTLSGTDWVYEGIIYVIGIAVTTLLHAFGHILGGKLASSPMDELVFTATRGVNIYHGDQTVYPSRVHLARACGGPVFNLVVAGMLYLLLPPRGQGVVYDLISGIAATNLFFGVFAFLPLPSVDGQVIWREVVRVLRSKPR